jgi:hypothetical protein
MVFGAVRTCVLLVALVLAEMTVFTLFLPCSSTPAAGNTVLLWC